MTDYEIVRAQLQRHGCVPSPQGVIISIAHAPSWEDTGVYVAMVRPNGRPCTPHEYAYGAPKMLTADDLRSVAAVIQSVAPASTEAGGGGWPAGSRLAALHDAGIAPKGHVGVRRGAQKAHDVARRDAAAKNGGR